LSIQNTLLESILVIQYKENIYKFTWYEGIHNKLLESKLVVEINTTCTNSLSVREIQNISLESIQVVKDKQNTYEFICYGGKIHKI